VRPVLPRVALGAKGFELASPVWAFLLVHQVMFPDRDGPGPQKPPKQTIVS